MMDLSDIRFSQSATDETSGLAMSVLDIIVDELDAASEITSESKRAFPQRSSLVGDMGFELSGRNPKRQSV
jgi:hypothetical protein